MRFSLALCSLLFAGLAFGGGTSAAASTSSAPSAKAIQMPCAKAYRITQSRVLTTGNPDTVGTRQTTSFGVVAISYQWPYANDLSSTRSTLVGVMSQAGLTSQPTRALASMRVSLRFLICKRGHTRVVGKSRHTSDFSADATQQAAQHSYWLPASVKQAVQLTRRGLWLDATVVMLGQGESVPTKVHAIIPVYQAGVAEDF